ncbi:MAG: zf-HC2 domain-containing protein [Isosphaeraceae bacterium]
MWASLCARVRSRLPLLVGGELVGPERRLAERHLLGCDRCRRKLADLRRSQGVLRAAAGHDPIEPEAPSLWPVLARQIRESRRPTLGWNRVEPRTMVRVAVSLAACLALAVGALIFRPATRELSRYKITVTPKQVAIDRLPDPPKHVTQRPRRPKFHQVTYRREIGPVRQPATPSKAARPQPNYARGPSPDAQGRPLTGTQ